MLLLKQLPKPPILERNKHKRLLLYKKHKLTLLKIKLELILRSKMLKMRLTRNMTLNNALYKKEIIRQHWLLKRKHLMRHKLQHSLKLRLKERQGLKKKSN
jgi:hypothetical protein